MCGHVGIAGKLTFKDERTMQQLLVYDYFRGKDSTGLAAIRGNGDSIVAKVPSDPIDLFDMGVFKKALNGSSSEAFIGHNRAATRGVVNTANSHPFQYGHIIGAHNGTLDHESTKALEEELDERFAVDSQAIFAGIAAFGIEKTISMMTEGRDASTGAWALVWYDLKERTLNFLRNKHRPLWYAYDKDYDRIFWASEWMMIRAACASQPVPYELHADEETGHTFFQFEENVHYKFDLKDFKTGKEKVKPLAKVLKGKEPAPAYTGGYTPFVPRETSGTGSGGAKPGQTMSLVAPSIKTSRSNPNPNIRVMELFGDKGSPFAGFVSKKQFDEVAKWGCSYCSCDVDYNDVGIKFFERTGTLLCNECSGGITGNHIYLPELPNL